ncbi:Fez zinc finger protein 1 [Phlyctochytrium planicorne]|nr:Fez zinc finger protein 1 [Phlyctochytrium planicorne]
MSSKNSQSFPHHHSVHPSAVPSAAAGAGTAAGVMNGQHDDFLEAKRLHFGHLMHPASNVLQDQQQQQQQQHQQQQQPHQPPQPQQNYMDVDGLFLGNAQRSVIQASTSANVLPPFNNLNWAAPTFTPSNPIPGPTLHTNMNNNIPNYNNDLGNANHIVSNPNINPETNHSIISYPLQPLNLHLPELKSESSIDPVVPTTQQSPSRSIHIPPRTFSLGNSLLMLQEGFMTPPLDVVTTRYEEPSSYFQTHPHQHHPYSNGSTPSRRMSVPSAPQSAGGAPMVLGTPPGLATTPKLDVPERHGRRRVYSMSFAEKKRTTQQRQLSMARTSDPGNGIWSARKPNFSIALPNAGLVEAGGTSSAMLSAPMPLVNSPAPLLNMQTPSGASTSNNYASSTSSSTSSSSSSTPTMAQLSTLQAVKKVTASGLTFYECTFPNCNKAFRRRYNLSSHYYTHTGEKPQVCEVCGASFSRRHDLKRHVSKLHDEERPFGCASCGQKFLKEEHLGRHRFVCDQALSSGNTGVGSGSGAVAGITSGVVAPASEGGDGTFKEE